MTDSLGSSAGGRLDSELCHPQRMFPCSLPSFTKRSVVLYMGTHTAGAQASPHLIVMFLPQLPEFWVGLQA